MHTQCRYGSYHPMHTIPLLKQKIHIECVTFTPVLLGDMPHIEWHCQYSARWQLASYPGVP